MLLLLHPAVSNLPGLRGVAVTRNFMCYMKLSLALEPAFGALAASVGFQPPGLCWGLLLHSAITQWHLKKSSSLFRRHSIPKLWDSGDSLSPPAPAVDFRNDFSISICSVSAAETAPAHRCVQTTLSTGAVVYWLPKVPGGQKKSTADIADCSCQEMRMFEDRWGTNFHPKWEVGEHEPVPKLSAESGNHL